MGQKNNANGFRKTGLDLQPVANRLQRRSKYGAKKNK